MGLFITSIAIDKQKIKDLFGSKDEQLFEYLKEKLDDSAYGTSVFTKTDAVHDIIFGETYKTEYGDAYGYAFYNICKYLGVELPYKREMYLSEECELFKEYLSEEFGANLDLEEELFGYNPNFPIADFPMANFPIIGILDQQNLGYLYDALPEITIESEAMEELWDSDWDRALVYDIIMGLRENIKFCMDNNLSLASFCL